MLLKISPPPSLMINADQKGFYFSIPYNVSWSISLYLPQALIMYAGQKHMYQHNLAFKVLFQLL